MKRPPARLTRSRGWVFPVILLGSVGLHLGFFLWRENLLWIVPGAPEPPLPVVEMIVVEERIEPERPVEEVPLEEPSPLVPSEPEEVPEPVVEEPPLPEPVVETPSSLPPPPPPSPPVRQTPKPTAWPKPKTPAAPPKVRPPLVEARPDQRHTPAPRYPDSARRAGQEGRVMVRAEVDASGRVRGVTLARSSGVGSLDRAALEAVRRWRFHPRLVEGAPAAATVEVPVFFSLTR